jgi:membrane protease YdiL (CAAX protease family)
VPALLGFALLVVPRLSGVRVSQLGFRPWREWTTSEKSYLFQVLVLANVVFPLMLLGPRANRAGPAHVFVTYLFFGFYQELVYRGMVQLGLVRRWGPALGILVANLLYTFGPLHWSYFASQPSFAVPMLAAIFAIGLFFGVLYHRSGNLWIVAVFHAIGNAYIVWGLGSVR